MLIALCRSPGQSYDELSNFVTNFESTLHAITLKKLFLTMLLGDFNAKNKLWFDQKNTTYERSILQDLMAQ